MISEPFIEVTCDSCEKVDRFEPRSFNEDFDAAGWVVIRRLHYGRERERQICATCTAWIDRFINGGGLVHVGWASWSGSGAKFTGLRSTMERETGSKWGEVYQWKATMPKDSRSKA